MGIPALKIPLPSFTVRRYVRVKGIYGTSPLEFPTPYRRLQILRMAPSSFWCVHALLTLTQARISWDCLGVWRWCFQRRRYLSGTISHFRMLYLCFLVLTWTSQLTDWLAHVPKEVIAKNFQTDISAFDDIPGRELYIFPAGMRMQRSVSSHCI